MNLTNRCPNACDFCLRTHGPGVGDAESLWLDREPTRDEIWEDLSKRDLNAYPELVFCGYGGSLPAGWRICSGFAARCARPAIFLSG